MNEFETLLVEILFIALYAAPFVAVFLVARWAARIRRALETAAPADLRPLHSQMERVVDSLDAIRRDLDTLAARQGDAAPRP